MNEVALLMPVCVIYQNTIMDDYDDDNGVVIRVIYYIT